MKIFLPFKKELNPYLEEIINLSQHTFSYAAFQEYNSSYQVVSIHWPEAIFGWMEPTQADLVILEQNILEWKKSSVLVYTKHDFQRNKGTTINFTKLFQLIERNTDVFIHLGKFSKNYYKKKFPLARHEIIHHPLYLNSFSSIDKNFARKKLHIDQKAFVVIVPGTIRNFAERDLILKAFETINISNKVLICINMRSELRYDFPGRIKLKRFIDVKKLIIDQFKKRYKQPKYLFTFGTQPQQGIEVKMSAADLVFIPRIHCLNSGMLFLGLTYEKIVLGPSVGNIKEQLIELKLPVFNPENNFSVKKALNKAIELSYKHTHYPHDAVSKYKPKSVAQKMDDLINSLK